MSFYPGPSGAIAAGNPVFAEVVRSSFDEFATAVNSVDGVNFRDARQLTYSAIHSGALTQSFQESQLIYGEPATWVAIGRAGSSPPDSYSLGVYENEYTVDGCGVRVLLTRPSLLKIDGFLKIDGVKLSSLIDTLHVNTVDLRLTLSMGYYKRDGDMTFSGSPGVQETVKDIRLDVDGADFAAEKDLRRGFSLHLTEKLGFSAVPDRGAFVDVWMKLSTQIIAASVDSDPNRLLASVSGNPLLYAHLKSESRGITVRAFQTGP